MTAFQLFPEAQADGFEAARGGRTLHADVVIVGTGPGGSAVGRVLAEGGLRVVFVEEGPAHSRFRPNQAHTARYHMQEQGTVVSRGNAFIPIAAGRGVGGGTLINSALSFRCPDDVLDGWAKRLDDPMWGPEALRPVYDEVSTIAGVGVTSAEISGENNNLIVRGVQAMGWEGGLAPRSAPRCVGCGICNWGCPSGGKASANLTFLPRAVQRGAVIQADTIVHEILVEDGRAKGIRGTVFHPDTREVVGGLVVHADHVILSAGALGTPRLLWRPGLGQRLGPVGKGLHIHPGNAVFGVCDTRVDMWHGATQGAYFHVPGLHGVLPHTVTVPPEILLVAMGTIGSKLLSGIEQLPYMCGLVVMVSDQAEGSVGATADGRADVHYEFDLGDLERTKAGMVAGARVLLAGGAKRVFVPVHGTADYTDPSALEASLRDRTLDDFALYASHPMSTCRMGLDPATSVVDPHGHAHHLPGLMIADASAFPTSLGVNPQLTTMALGTTIGRSLLAG